MHAMWSLAAFALHVAATPNATLSSSFLRIGITVTKTGTFISDFAILQDSSNSNCGGRMTTNLIQMSGSGAYPALHLSGTGLSTAPGEWLFSHGGSIESSSPKAAVLRGVQVGPHVTEDWRLAVNDSTFTWQINRTFHAQMTVLQDRFPALSFQGSFSGNAPPPDPDPEPCGGPGPADICAETQMVGFLDPNFIVDNNTDQGFFVPTNIPNVGYAGYAPSKSEYLQLSPCGMALLMNFTTGDFSATRFAYVGGPSAFGPAVVSPLNPDGFILAHNGDKWTQMMSIKLEPSRGSAPLLIERQDGKAVDPTITLAKQFAVTHNLFLGSIYGNSPTSVTCLHEMSCFPQYQSLLGRFDGATYDPVHDAIGNQISYLLKSSMNGTGGMYSRWDMLGVEQHHNGRDSGTPFGCIVDQHPHMILAFHQHSINTGNEIFVQDHMPMLERVAGWIRGDFGLGLDTNGVTIVSCTNGKPYVQGHPARPSNWYDTIAFGHMDALTAAYSVWAMHAMAELYQFIDNPQKEIEYRGVHKHAVEEYQRQLWDENFGFFSDWSDSDGSRRRYGFTWHNMLAASYGIASPSQIHRMLNEIDKRLSNITNDPQFNLTEPPICTPSPLWPADPADVMYCNAGKGSKWPYYENGDCFLVANGFELLARARNGNATDAWSRFERLMSAYNQTRLWGQRFAWSRGFPRGNDILTDQLQILWGALLGGFGIQPTLNNGLQSVNEPAKQLEGVSWSFVYKGKVVRVEVDGGQVYIS